MLLEAAPALVAPAVAAGEPHRGAALTQRRAPVTLRDMIEVINPILRGWGNYYRKANVRKLFHRLANAELTADLLNIGWFALVGNAVLRAITSSRISGIDRSSDHR